MIFGDKCAKYEFQRDCFSPFFVYCFTVAKQAGAFVIISFNHRTNDNGMNMHAHRTHEYVKARCSGAGAAHYRAISECGASVPSAERALIFRRDYRINSARFSWTRIQIQWRNAIMHNRVSSVSSFNIHKCDTIASAFYLFNFTFVSLYYGITVFTILFFRNQLEQIAVAAEGVSVVSWLAGKYSNCSIYCAIATKPDKTEQTRPPPFKLLPVNMQRADRRPSASAQRIFHGRFAFGSSGLPPLMPCTYKLEYIRPQPVCNCHRRPPA